jgi:DNA-binding transcriptional LysR family regulator
MDRLTSMRVFQRVVDEGGFAAAARSLDMSPAVVTRMVADLEDHLGVRLVHRTTRRIALSEAGEIYLNRVRAILQDIDEAHDLVRSNTTELAGVLHILISPLMANSLLASIVADFRSLYPKITLNITVESFIDPPVEDFDITLFAAPQDYNGNVIARKILTTEVILAASPAYLKRKGFPKEPGDLVQHDCMHIQTGLHDAGMMRLESSTNADGGCEVLMQFAVTVNHPDTMLRLTRDGVGISPIAVALAAPYLISGELVQVLHSWRLGRMNVYAALPSRKYLPHRTQVFLNYVTEQIRAVVEAATREQ